MPETRAYVCAPAAQARLGRVPRELLWLDAHAAAALYARRDPAVDVEALAGLLERGARRFVLSGVDLLRVDASPGAVVLEANSAPGFAYCTPEHDAWELAYLRTAALVRHALTATEAEAEAGAGDVALLTEDKLPVETAGFRAALGATFGGQVAVHGPAELARAERRDGFLHVGGRRVLGGLRYLHSAPWTLLPPDTAGGFVNGTAVDLAGARDKIAAWRAFEEFNRTRPAGVPALAVPPSRSVASAVELAELAFPLVLKPPHLNSGSGLVFLTERPAAGAAEPAWPVLAQQMLLPAGATAAGAPGQRLLAGYVHDLRFVVGSGPRGFFPLMLYARRARLAWRAGLSGADLAAALTTNIAVPDGAGGYRFEYERLVLPTEEGWSRLGLEREDFAVLFVQSALATAAIDAHTEVLPCAASPAS